MVLAMPRSRRPVPRHSGTVLPTRRLGKQCGSTRNFRHGATTRVIQRRPSPSITCRVVFPLEGNLYGRSVRNSSPHLFLPGTIPVTTPRLGETPPTRCRICTIAGCAPAQTRASTTSPETQASDREEAGALAKFFVATIQGIRAMARLKSDRRALRQVAKIALAVLQR